MSTYFLTGGIGDVFVLDSHWTPHQKATLTKVYTATRQHESIKQLLLSSHHYSQLQSVVSLVDTWTTDRQAYYSKIDFETSGITLPPDWSSVEDQSILIQFFLPLTFQGSSFLSAHKPTETAVIVPSSTNWYPGRDFSRRDWGHCLDYLHTHKLKGVVLGHPQPLPKHPLIEDHTGASMGESIASLHTSRAYIGIDSCLSVLAAQLPLKLKVKCRSPHCLDWKHLYFAPRTDFHWLKGYI